MRRIGFFILLISWVSPPSAAGDEPRRLRVCADPNNLPFSNRRGEGFENRIADVLARELGATVEYTWHPQRRGFFRRTLKARLCDVVVGVPSGFEMTLTTRPYYRSSYVFLHRRDRRWKLRSFDDPALRRLRIGVPVVGDDGANPPPAHALARRGIVDNVVGFPVYGDYGDDVPQAKVGEAVATGAIDVGIVWGPLAGWLARRSRSRLAVTPLAGEGDAGQPIAFDIAVGVRRGDRALRDELDGALARRRGEIERILADYGVPRVAKPAASGVARK